MTVQELIDELIKVKDKSKEVLHIDDEYLEVNYVIDYKDNVLLSRSIWIGC